MVYFNTTYLKQACQTPNSLQITCEIQFDSLGRKTVSHYFVFLRLQIF